MTPSAPVAAAAASAPSRTRCGTRCSRTRSLALAGSPSEPLTTTVARRPAGGDGAHLDRRRERRPAAAAQAGRGDLVDEVVGRPVRDRPRRCDRATMLGRARRRDRRVRAAAAAARSGRAGGARTRARSGRAHRVDAPSARTGRATRTITAAITAAAHPTTAQRIQANPASRADLQPVDQGDRPAAVGGEVDGAPRAVGQPVAQQAGDDDGEDQVERDRAEPEPQRAIAGDERHERVDDADAHERVGHRGGDVHGDEHDGEERRVAVQQLDDQARRDAPVGRPCGRDAEDERDRQQDQGDESRTAGDVPGETGGDHDGSGQPLPRTTVAGVGDGAVRAARLAPRPTRTVDHAPGGQDVGLDAVGGRRP